MRICCVEMLGGLGGIKKEAEYLLNESSGFGWIDGWIDRYSTY